MEEGREGGRGVSGGVRGVEGVVPVDNDPRGKGEVGIGLLQVLFCFEGGEREGGRKDMCVCVCVCV
jgi:hypothetical protein